MKLSSSPVVSFLEIILKHRLGAAVVLLILTGFSLSQIRGLRISVDMEDFFVSTDPVLKNNAKYEELFQNSDFIGVLVESDNVFDRDVLELIRRVGNRLKSEVPLAGSIISVAELNNFPLSGKTLEFNGETLTSTDSEIEDVKEIYRNIPSIGGTLFSLNSHEAWIILQLNSYTEGWNQFSIGEKAYEVLTSIDPGNARLTGTGVPVYAYRKETEMMKDLTRVLIFGGLAAFILSILIIRSFRGVAGAILIILFSVLIVFGLQGWRHTTIDSAFISVPILLTMGVSIGYTVHLTRFFRHDFLQQGKRREAVLYAVQESGKSILFTAFTTVAALFSFTFVEIQPIQWVGFTSALSISAVCVLTLVFYPILLSIGKDSAPKAGMNKVARFEPLMVRTALFVEKKRIHISILFLLSVLISIIGLFRLDIDFNGLKMMGDRLNHMKDQIHISQSKIASSETLELVIQLDPGDFKTLPALRNLESLEQDIRKNPLVKDTHSLAGAIKEFNFLRSGRSDKKYIIPEKDSLIRGLLLYFERLSPETLRSWIDDNYSTARMNIEMKDFSSKEIEGLVAETEKLVELNFPDRTDFFMSGSSYQMAVMNQYITRGLVKSVLTATAMILLLLIILFRSIKLGFIAMIPNIYPLLICGAIMGFAGIPMEFVTMTIAPMIMGLAVDDTIHFIAHIGKNMKSTGDVRRSIRFAFRTVGTAISETTVILCLTFLVFLVSDINSIRNMGVLSAAGMAAAYCADIFITPLLISYFYSKNNAA